MRVGHKKGAQAAGPRSAVREGFVGAVSVSAESLELDRRRDVSIG